ncbi:hypothetical protein [Kaarinaea lacus]
MLLEQLQCHLEDIYEVQTQHRVHDFLINDAALASHLDNGANARELPEKLLIRENGEFVDIALYLDESLLRRLEENDPIQSLHNQNIHDFWTALEGISHFLYFTWNVEYQRGVSLLELELQAEVDKYIVAVWLLEKQLANPAHKSVHRHLFHNAVFDHRLNEDELFRYRNANDLAAKFCAFIQDCINKRVAHKQILNHLRRFYRLTHHHKIKAIAKL